MIPSSPPAYVLQATQHLAYGGLDRTYRVYVPRSANRAAAVPLVIVLHGGFGSGAQAEGAYGWDALADRKGFIVAYPDGYRHSWNAGSCCGPAQRENVDDTGFLDAMISRIEEMYRIDRSAVAIAGMSNGAMMAQRMGCESTVPLRAVGSVSGTLAVPCAKPQRLNFIEIHGAADKNIPFGGGTGRGAARVRTAPIEDVVAHWRANGDCAAPQTRVQGDVRAETATCADGKRVELIAIQGAGHQWPGSKPASRRTVALARFLGLPGIDPPSTAIDATSVLYEFFFGTP